MATKEEQIKALLAGNAYALACKELNVGSMAQSSYASVFTVKYAEILEYVKKHGLPGNAYCAKSEEHMCEGLHFISHTDYYEIFWLERGQREAIGRYKNKDDALQKLIDVILNMAGTGIDFKGHAT